MKKTVLIALLLSSGCDTSLQPVGAAGSGDPAAPGTQGGAGSGASGGGAGSGGGASSDGSAGAASGLPCDVDRLLADSCRSCHGAVPAAGAPMPLVTWADLAAAAGSDPARTVAEVSLARMRSASQPMPPGSHLPAAVIETFAAWVAAGHPHGACGGTGPADPVDAGVTAIFDAAAPGPTDLGRAPRDLGARPVDIGHAVADLANPNAPVCTSMKTWTQGDSGSSLMHPGRACITCHASRGAPTFTIAGTLFPTAHEPDDCDGASGSARVVIVDAKGVTLTLTPNSAGNFYSSTAITKPYKASIVDGQNVRAMGGAQTTGDCNSCHTVAGANGAPGRIMTP